MGYPCLATDFRDDHETFGERLVKLVLRSSDLLNLMDFFRAAASILSHFSDMLIMFFSVDSISWDHHSELAGVLVNSDSIL